MKKIVLLLALSVLFINCSEKGILSVTNKPINDFTWRAMNSWYKWQENVPELRDSKLKNFDTYEDYLNKYDKATDLFNSLLYKKGEVDRFSWFIQDYEEQEKSFQGVSKSFGFRPVKLELKNGNIVWVVSKVSENSPASRAGLVRGNIIIGVNNQKFNEGVYNTIREGYFNDSAEFIIGEKDAKTVIKKVAITREEVADNAIQLTKVIDVDGKKVGYFVYNGFRSSYNKAMNNAFAKFQNKGITEFILDLRYNGGGSLYTCTYLAGLIHGEATTKDVFSKTIWNAKHSERNTDIPFLDAMLTFNANGNYIKGGDIPLNKLKGIEKLYVITSGSTASASELVINGLRPYMNVITVGTTTYGKNVGSITLYDSRETDFRSKKGINKTHKKAMQPITFQIYNKLNQGDYTSGIAADVKVNEFENLDGFLAFGDENETLLKTVLNKIKGVSGRPQKTIPDVLSATPLEKKSFETEMYFEDTILDNYFE